MTLGLQKLLGAAADQGSAQRPIEQPSSTKALSGAASDRLPEGSGSGSGSGSISPHQRPLVMVLSDDPRVHRQMSAIQAAGFATILVTSDALKIAAALSPTAKSGRTTLGSGLQAPAVAADAVLSWDSLRLGEYRCNASM